MIATARMIETPYSHPSDQPCDSTPRIKDASAAKHSIWMVWSSKFSIIMSQRVLGYFTTGSFWPNLFARSFLSASEKGIPFCSHSLRTLMLVLMIS